MFFIHYLYFILKINVLFCFICLISSILALISSQNITNQYFHLLSSLSLILSHSFHFFPWHKSKVDKLWYNYTFKTNSFQRMPKKSNKKSPTSSRAPNSGLKSCYNPSCKSYIIINDQSNIDSHLQSHPTCIQFYFQCIGCKRYFRYQSHLNQHISSTPPCQFLTNQTKKNLEFILKK